MDLFDRHLLPSKYKAIARDSQVKFKLVDVHVVRFVVEKDDEMKLGHFAYTVMAECPPDCQLVRYESREVALRKALGISKAEIGIASFIDNEPSRTSGACGPSDLRGIGP